MSWDSVMTAIGILSLVLTIFVATMQKFKTGGLKGKVSVIVGEVAKSKGQSQNIRQATPLSLEAARPHHLPHHPHHPALLKAAVLATVPSPLVHGAVLFRLTNILGVLLDCPLEETLAALAGEDTVVMALGVITAHSTE